METFTCMNQKTCCMLHQLPKSKWDLTKTRSRLFSRGRFYSSFSFFPSFCFEVRAHLAQQHTLVTGGSSGDNYTEFLSFILSYLLLLPSLTWNYIPAEVMITVSNPIQVHWNYFNSTEWCTSMAIFNIFNYTELLSFTLNYLFQLHSITFNNM